MNQEREVELSQNDGGKQERNEQVETVEEYQARWEENAAWARREFTTRANQHKTIKYLRWNTEGNVLLHAAMMQEDKTTDWEDYFEKNVRNPMFLLKDGDQTVLRSVHDYIETILRRDDRKRLEGESNSADIKAEVGIDSGEEYPQIDGDQQEETEEERQARWEKNVVFATRVITSQIDRYKEKSFCKKYFAQIVQMYAKMMQADKTRDWDAFFEIGFRKVEMFSTADDKTEVIDEDPKVEVMMENLQLEQDVTDNGAEEQQEENKEKEEWVIIE